MPQMAPISWFLLFIIFFLTLIMFSIMNYYIFFYPNNMVSPASIKNKEMFWKW